MALKGFMDLVVCPGCGQPAEVAWHAKVSSTAGPVEHVRIDCLLRQWFLMPSDRLTPWPEASPAVATTLEEYPQRRRGVSPTRPIVTAQLVPGCGT